MKVLIIFVTILYSINIFGQGTTGCCPLKSKAYEIINDDIVIKSCLLCKKSPAINIDIHLNKFSEERGGVQNHKKAKKENKRMFEKRMFETCQKMQRAIITDAIRLIKEYNKSTKSNLESMEEVVDAIAIKVGIETTETLENKVASKEKSVKCNDDVSLKEKSNKPNRIDQVVTQLVELKQANILLTKGFCLHYEFSEKEEEMLKLIDQIDSIKSSK